MNKKRRHEYTPVHLAYIKVMCKTLSDSELCEKFNLVFGTDLTLTQIKKTRARHGFLTGRDGRFYPGMKKLAGSGAKKANRGSFKKGTTPHNQQPIGTEVLRPREDLIYTKIAEPNKWQSKHSIIWERHHKRKVPDGHMITFADGNRRNFDISNLRLVSRGDMAVFNKRGYSHADAEIRPTLLLATQVDVLAFKHEREAI